MRLQRVFFINFLFFTLLSGSDFAISFANQSGNLKIEQIDRQIEELEAYRLGCISRANRFDDQAERLQFQDRSFLESRRLSELAQENRDKAQRAQEQIDRLKKERELLLRSNS